MYATILIHVCSFNNPITYNDPLGDCPTCPQYQRSDDTWWVADRRTLIGSKYAGFSSFIDWALQNRGVAGGDTNPWAWTGMSSSDIYGTSFSMYGVGSSMGSITHQEYVHAVEKAKGPTVYNKWCKCRVPAIEVLAYDETYQNSEFRETALKALINYYKDKQQQTQGNGPGDPYGWDNFFKDAKTGATVVRGLTSARRVIENVYIEQATINNAIRGSTAAVPNSLRTISTVSKVAGGFGIAASWGIAFNELANDRDNTSTWVNAGVNTLIIGAAILGGPITVGVAAVAGIAYGVSYFMYGDEMDAAINNTFGYR
ncbi:MAG: hypothetical protein KF763_19905 [Cyclobacteriaceae bacterium]|nr:hypothetical protein [Cyclobacteriaceae bacterium]